MKHTVENADTVNKIASLDKSLHLKVNEDDVEKLVEYAKDFFSCFIFQTLLYLYLTYVFLYII